MKVSVADAESRSRTIGGLREVPPLILAIPRRLLAAGEYWAPTIRSCTVNRPSLSEFFGKSDSLSFFILQIFFGTLASFIGERADRDRMLFAGSQGE